MRAAGRHAILIQADVATPDATRHLIDTAIAAFGRFDILVNNAGIALIEPLLQASAADWDMTMAVNLRAPFLLARALAADAPALLADEPTGNLDEATADTVMDLMLELASETNAALLMVTHSQRLAGRMGRRLHLRAGRIDGSPT